MYLQAFAHVTEKSTFTITKYWTKISKAEKKTFFSLTVIVNVQVHRMSAKLMPKPPTVIVSSIMESTGKLSENEPTQNA